MKKMEICRNLLFHDVLPVFMLEVAAFSLGGLRGASEYVEVLVATFTTLCPQPLFIRTSLFSYS